ncbi:hypothetical protein Tco_0884298 [Tanacetum coccineum]
MITTSSRTGSKKPSGLILPPMGILETFPCVKDVDYITRDLAVSSVRKDIMRTNARKQTTGLQAKLTLEPSCFLFTLGVLPENNSPRYSTRIRIGLHAKNPNHQATILVVCYFYRLQDT